MSNQQNISDIMKFVIGICIILAGAIIIVRAVSRIIEIQILGRL